jgi:hypothetical protein
MKTILRKPEVSHFNISNHLGFHVLVYGICYKYRAKINNPALLEAYDAAVQQEAYVFKWGRKSEFTQKKARADRYRDHALKGIAGIIRNDTKHSDPVMRNHAIHLKNLLDAYGKLTRVAYDAETANIDSLLERLQGDDYEKAVKALGIARWVNELDQENQRFKGFAKSFADEQLAKPNITASAARRHSDLSLRTLTNHITSLITLNGQAEFQAFIDEFNVVVGHYNTVIREHYGRLHARINIAPADIVNIPIQAYTGKPVFVIPELTLTVEREGKVHVLHPLFSEDFTVSYKNNIAPGTATLTVHGIGKFMGEIVTRFTIEAEF